MTNIELIESSQKKIILLRQIYDLLQWDQVTYMPKKGIKSRSEQLALVNCLIHEILTNNNLYIALKESITKQENDYSLKNFLKEIEYARKIPIDLLEEYSKTVSQAVDSWKEAKIKNDFNIFLPYLKKLVSLNIKKIKLINIPGHPYNSLLYEYDKEMTVEKLKPFFYSLKIELKELLLELKKSKKFNIKTFDFDENYSRKKILEIVEFIYKKMGLNKSFFRFDYSIHPFSKKIGYNDGRITLINERNPVLLILSAMHEAGHILYDLGLPENDKYKFIGQIPSLSLYESQSRFWETMLGMNKSFWDYYFNDFSKKININIPFDEFYFKINKIDNSPLRINSDEINYFLHIILRFEIECDLFEDKINNEEFPEIWNKKSFETLGITPKNDSEGILQDIHWSVGLFGYFPTYAIGTIYAFNFFNAMKKEFDIETDLKNGDYKKIIDWLKNKIFLKASKQNQSEILNEICYNPLDVTEYITYLKEKYYNLYGIEK